MDGYTLLLQRDTRGSGSSTNTEEIVLRTNYFNEQLLGF